MLIIEQDFARKHHNAVGVRFFYEGRERYKKVEEIPNMTNEELLERLMQYIPTICYGAGAGFNVYTITIVREVNSSRSRDPLEIFDI